MPRPDLILPGFFGKLPLAGDFVGRGLPTGFVRTWDRWCARHLAPLPPASWPAGGIRFALSAPATGLATGLVVASCDRAGRAFPLTVAAVAPRQVESWYDRLAELAEAAAAGRIGPDALGARLGAEPAAPAAGAADHSRAVLWRAGGIPREVDLSSPAMADLVAETVGPACGR